MNKDKSLYYDMPRGGFGLPPVVYSAIENVQTGLIDVHVSDSFNGKMGLKTFKEAENFIKNEIQERLQNRLENCKEELKRTKRHLNNIGKMKRTKLP